MLDVYTNFRSMVVLTSLIVSPNTAINLSLSLSNSFHLLENALYILFFRSPHFMISGLSVN